MAKKKARAPFTQDDNFRSSHVIDAVYTADGTAAIYQRTHTVKADDEERTINSLHLVELDSGQSRALTAHANTAASPQISPDGQWLYYVSAPANGSAAPQVVRMPLSGGGEPQAITELPQGILAYALSPDGKHIAFTALSAPPPQRGPDDHVRVTRLAYRADKVGYIEDMLQTVNVVPAAGGKVKTLNEAVGMIAGVTWSPDSKEIFYAQSHRPTATRYATVDVLVADRAGKNTVTLSEELATLFVPVFVSDDKLAVSIFPKGNLGLQPRLQLMDRATGKLTGRAKSIDLPTGFAMMQINSASGGVMGRILSADGGKTVIASVADGGRGQIGRFSTRGKESCEILVDGERTARALAVKDGKLLFVATDMLTPNELFELDLASKKERQLTDHNSAWQATVQWPEVERITATPKKGVEIEGWVLKPRGSRGPCKTVLEIHGGPHAAYGYGYSEDHLELVGAGYAVAFCNPRGSTGYGDAFEQSIVKTWGHPEYADFNAFLDTLVERKISDADKLGITGVSGGGHLSAWMIGQTRRFKAAVPEQGVYNMLSMYGTSDAGHALLGSLFGGAPEKQFKLFWDLSPIAHAHKVVTPTLLIQGENDIRCPMEQAEALFTVMKLAGCEVELLRLNQCSHGEEVLGRPKLRRFRMDAIKDWFDRHIS